MRLLQKIADTQQIMLLRDDCIRVQESKAEKAIRGYESGEEKSNATTKTVGVQMGGTNCVPNSKYVNSTLRDNNNAAHKREASERGTVQSMEQTTTIPSPLTPPNGRPTPFSADLRGEAVEETGSCKCDERQVLAISRCGSGNGFGTAGIPPRPDVASTAKRCPPGDKPGHRNSSQVHQLGSCNRTCAGYQVRGGEGIDTVMQDLDNVQRHEDAATDVSFKENGSSGSDCRWDRNPTMSKIIGMLHGSADDEEVIRRHNELMQTLDQELDEARATLFKPIIEDTPAAIAPTPPLLAFLPAVIHAAYGDANEGLHSNSRQYSNSNRSNDITVHGEVQDESSSYRATSVGAPPFNSPGPKMTSQTKRVGSCDDHEGSNMANCGKPQETGHSSDSSSYSSDSTWSNTSEFSRNHYDIKLSKINLNRAHSPECKRNEIITDKVKNSLHIEGCDTVDATTIKNNNECIPNESQCTTSIKDKSSFYSYEIDGLVVKRSENGRLLSFNDINRYITFEEKGGQVREEDEYPTNQIPAHPSDGKKEITMNASRMKVNAPPLSKTSLLFIHMKLMVL